MAVMEDLEQMVEVVVDHQVKQKFVKSATPQDTFYYQRGHVKTDLTWKRPTWERVYAYLMKVKDFGYLDKYDVYLRGGFLYNINDTWDLDIHLVGDFPPKELESDLNILLHVALNHFRLLVDIKVYPEFFKEFTLEEIEKGIYSTNYEVTYCLKRINDEESVQDRRTYEGVEKLTEFLIKIHKLIHHKPLFVEKLKTGKLCQSMKAKHFLSLSEPEFFKETYAS